MFKVGDLVRGKENNGYAFTNEESLCEVERILGEGMQVRIVGSIYKYEVGHSYPVKIERFYSETVANYMALYPEAVISERILRSVEPKIPTVMDKTEIYVLSETERNNLIKETLDLLDSYGIYHAAREGVSKIIDTWAEEKGWMVNLFSKHPNYNGKYQIVFDQDYLREINIRGVNEFGIWLSQNLSFVEEPVKIGAFDYDEINCHIAYLTDLRRAISAFPHYKTLNIQINGLDAAYYERERMRWVEKAKLYYENPNIHVDTDYAITEQSHQTMKKIRIVGSMLSGQGNFDSPLANADFVCNINDILPEVKAVEGQKISRIINKFCKLTGMDKHPDYNREFAKFADAINPLLIKRHTVLSCHPIDYFLMSNGNSWHSCHSIDLKYVNGCYSSGTLSYMLDDSSFIFYTVNKDYEGDRIELEPKINRCMFHMGEDKLIQGRVYPQNTDGAESVYKNIRTIVQKVIADCLKVPNLWTNKKGTNRCSSMISSYGTHYRDYFYQEDCNVSFLTREGVINRIGINVGTEPICPCCGEEHHDSYIECDCCYEEKIRCSRCGEAHREAFMFLIDEEWYCRDCVHYCDYCHEYEPITTEHYETADGNYVCDLALENGDYVQCDHCGDFVREGYEIETEDGNIYCCGGCAERDGYINLNDEWVRIADTIVCPECGQIILKEDYDEELECCPDCREMRLSRETEERSA